MRFSSLPPWLAPAAAGLLLASCQGQSTSSDTAAVTGQLTEAALTDTASVPTPHDGITPALLARHIKVLASDEYQGRRPFTAGEEKATTYLAGEFKKLGLKPGNGSSYFQPVPLVEITGRPDSTATIAGHGKSLMLHYRTDYMFLTEQEKPTIVLKNSPLVFAGYGVTAPEYKWDDYAST